jgi:hypothetical protein
MKPLLTLMLVLPLIAADAVKDKPKPAWGEPAGGLQIGILLHKDHAPAHAEGEHVQLDLRIRNASDKPIEHHQRTMDDFYTPPIVRDAAADKDVKVIAPNVQYLGAWAILRYTLAPGEERHLATITVVFDPNAPEKDDSRRHFVAKAGNGRYKVSYESARASAGGDGPAVKLESAPIEIQVGK